MGVRALSTLKGDGFEAAEKQLSTKGHGFSRAIKSSALDGFSRWGTAFNAVSK
jgi:hypothetical protein